MDTLSVSIRNNYKVIMIGIAPFTLGLGTLALWYQTRSWPKFLDQEGVILRSGRRLLWKDIEYVQPVAMVNNKTGSTITSRLDLVFGKHVVKIVPHSLVQGKEVLAFLSKVFDEDFSLD